MAVYRTDAEGHCVYVSDKLCELFGLTREQLLSTGWMDRIHPEDRERLERQRTNAIGPLKTFSVRYRVIVDGRTKWVEAFSTALMEGDRFVGRSGTVREIPEPAQPSIATSSC
jgi:PAS domain S-box-containing protein